MYPSRICALTLVAALSSLSMLGEARAEPIDRWLRAGALERGCTMMRGQRTCARYCYIEANGFRYCRERERYAGAQAPFLADAEQPAPVK